MLHNLQACEFVSSLTCHSFAEFTRCSKNIKTVHQYFRLDNGGIAHVHCGPPVAVFKLLSPQLLQWILHRSP
jgi:hypothetical protein